MRFTDGRVFDSVPGSGTQLTNVGVSALGSPDLMMFRLVEDPGLSPLEIGTSSLTAGNSVTMIGAGRDRASGLDAWVFNSSTGGTWTPTILPRGNVFGYALLSSQTMRWGTNSVNTASMLINSNTRGFSTTFSRQGDSFEGQAVTGDSGGGVFRFVDNQWQLAGIMDAEQLLANQPSDTVVFGDQTQAADLFTYRSQIVDLIARADAAFQNQRNYFDVDGSGAVSSFDALLVINDLLDNGSHELTGAAGREPVSGRQRRCPGQLQRCAADHQRAAGRHGQSDHGQRGRCNAHPRAVDVGPRPRRRTVALRGPLAQRPATRARPLTGPAGALLLVVTFRPQRRQLRVNGFPGIRSSRR